MIRLASQPMMPPMINDDDVHAISSLGFTVLPGPSGAPG
jgi:hypothetical protein